MGKDKGVPNYNNGGTNTSQDGDFRGGNGEQEEEKERAKDSMPTRVTPLVTHEDMEMKASQPAVTAMKTCPDIS